MRAFVVALSLVVVAQAQPAAARAITVRPGHSIQAAVDAAHPGDVILVSPGTYHEAGRPCPADPSHTCACLDPEDAVCAVPRGTGILVLAADENVVEQNVVVGNDSFGIAVADFCVSQDLDPATCAALGIEPSSDDTRVVGNLVLANGGDPDPALDPVFAVDLAWDTTGTGNCWSRNLAGTQFPDELPACS